MPLSRQFTKNLASSLAQGLQQNYQRQDQMEQEQRRAEEMEKARISKSIADDLQYQREQDRWNKERNTLSAYEKEKLDIEGKRLELLRNKGTGEQPAKQYYAGGRYTKDEYDDFYKERLTPVINKFLDVMSNPYEDPDQQKKVLLGLNEQYEQNAKILSDAGYGGMIRPSLLNMETFDQELKPGDLFQDAPSFFGPKDITNIIGRNLYPQSSQPQQVQQSQQPFRQTPDPKAKKKEDENKDDIWGEFGGMRVK